MKFYSVSLLCCMALGCATKAEVQFVDRKVDKLAVREDKRWGAQVAYDKQEPDRIVSAIQGNIDSGRVRDQLGGGPQQHLPSHIGGMPVVRPSDPRDPRLQWTTMWDNVRGGWVVAEYDVQHVGPAVGHPGSSPGGAPPAGGVLPTQPGTQPSAPGNPSIGGNNISGLRSHLQDVTGLLRDFQNLQDVLGGGQRDQFSALNQRIDQLAAQVTSLSSGQQKELEELQHLRAEHQRMMRQAEAMQGDIQGLRNVGETHIERLRSLGYEVVVSDDPAPKTASHRYNWSVQGYYGGRSCVYDFSYTPPSRPGVLRRIFGHRRYR